MVPRPSSTILPLNPYLYCTIIIKSNGSLKRRLGETLYPDLDLVDRAGEARRKGKGMKSSLSSELELRVSHTLRKLRAVVVTEDVRDRECEIHRSV